MNFAAKILVLAVLLGAVGYAQFPAFQHVIVVFQENRTPDNLFHDICAPPWWTGGNCPYDIQTTFGSGTPLAPVGLATNFDLGHSHTSFTTEKSGGTLTPGCGGTPTLPTYGCAPSTWNQYMYVENGVPLKYSNSYGKGTTHILDPYYNIATKWGWANFMYQTNQGPSYPAHQFIFGGTSARTFTEDQAGTFVSENFSPQGAIAGCFSTGFNNLIDINGVETQIGGAQGDFCFNRGTGHNSLAELLDNAHVTWKYYAPSAGSIWTAPNSIEPLCVPNYTTGKCTNQEYKNNVIFETTGNRAQFLKDLTNTATCSLPQVSWVIPDGSWSDHAKGNAGLGPSWVAAIVNAVGQNTVCNYWQNTAIVITWDDWGGWFDHEPPYTNTQFPNYTLSYRVPLLVVSGYTPKNFVNNTKPLDFGSILRMIEGVFLGTAKEGALGMADQRNATSDLHEFFPGPFQPWTSSNVVVSVQDATFFINQQKLQAQAPDTPVDPDDD